MALGIGNKIDFAVEWGAGGDGRRKNQVGLQQMETLSILKG